VADKPDSKINELYQLPLDEFTKARNALAKTLSGDDKSVVASLTKPTVPLWAVNQLYWKDAATYKALVDASEKLRTAHRAVLGGKNADIRKPDEVHRAALERAIAKTSQLLEQATGRVSEPVRETIRRTLAALPTEETAGRLTREPPPAGFGLLAGVTPAVAPRTAETSKRKTAASRTEDTAAVRAKERAAERAAEDARKRAEQAREKALTAARAQLKAAQRAAERATFAVRKAEVDLEQAQAAEIRASNQLKNAQSKIEELER
jgi:hypothetical protein